MSLNKINIVVAGATGYVGLDLINILSRHLRANIKYYKHTGYPGGIKETSPIKLKEKNKSQEILKLAVKRMLPDGPLAKKQLTKLKMYYGEKHPHSSQNPIEINFSKINKKNYIEH